MNFTLSDFLSVCGGRLVSGGSSDRLGPVSTDTRTLRDGDTFFALEGPRFDGHAFIQDAADRGAKTIVVHRMKKDGVIKGNRQPSIVLVEDTLRALQALAKQTREAASATFIGITGSNGKTTTKEMLLAILKKAGTAFATRGNLNNHIGLPLTLCEMPEGARYAVLELGTSKPGDMDLLFDLAQPHISLITNVGKDHLEFVGSPEGMLQVNRPLVDRLAKTGIAVINVDDPLLAPLAHQLSCQVVTYGLSKKADIRAEKIEPWPLPLRFVLCVRDQKLKTTLSSPGRFQVFNALAAAACAHAAGLTVETIVEGLKEFHPAPMRMQVISRPDGSVLVNDAYNANPSSMRIALKSFMEAYPEQKRWAVLGDMRELGAATREEHRALGEWLAHQKLDRLFLYGRDTRFVEDAIFGGSLSVERFLKKRYLVGRLRSLMAQEKPAVIFKASRSMKLEDVVKGL